MSCILLYQGKEFHSEEEILQFIAYGTGGRGPRASAKTIAKMKEFLKRIGVKYEQVEAIYDEKGNKLGASGVANHFQNLVQIVYGFEDQTLTEEAAHFAVRIISQTNPQLYQQMQRKINQYSVYDEVLRSPFYQKTYAHPDKAVYIARMKEEAIGKLLARTIIDKTDNPDQSAALKEQATSWWNRIVEWLKGLFNKAGGNPFEQAAEIVLQDQPAGGVFYAQQPDLTALVNRVKEKNMPGIFGEIFNNTLAEGNPYGALDMIRQQLADPATFDIVVNEMLAGDTQLGKDILEALGDKLYAEAEDPQQNLFNKLLAQHRKLSKESEKGDTFYVLDGKRVPNRVTDLSKEWGERMFRNKQMGKTERQKMVEDLKKDKGTAGHKDMENLFHRYVDANGYLRETPLELPSPVISDNPKILQTLDNYIRDLLHSYPKGTRFLSEIQVYDPAKKGGEAGTMDFVAITAEGVVDIKDWKFMDISPYNDDVPWYKKETFNIQISEYKRILQKVYGVSKFGQTRAIPILTDYRWNDRKTKDELILAGISIGSLDPKKIKDLRLLPVATTDESTGDAKIDALLSRLNSLYKKLYSQKVEEGRRDIKSRKLNDLAKAIRTLQVQGEVEALLTSSTSIIAGVESNLAGAQKRLKEDRPFTEEEKNSLAGELLQDYEIVEFYKELKKSFKNFPISTADATKLETLSSKASDILEDIQDLRGEVGDIIANGYGIKHLLNPETVVGAISRNFRSLSSARTKATQVLWRIVEKFSGQVNVKYDQEIKKLEAHKEALDALAKQRGISTEELFKELLEYKDKHWTGQLIRKISADFYNSLTDHLKEGNKTWVRENVDMEAYRKWYEEQLKSQTEKEKNTTYDYFDQEANVKEQTRRINEFKAKYDPAQDSAYSLANNKLRRFPKEDLWKSTEYKKLEQPGNEALLNFYNYWLGRVRESHKLGMLEEVATYRFVPNVRRSFLEKNFDGVRNQGIKGLKINLLGGTETDGSTDVVRDPFTGKPTDKLAAHYVYDLGQRVTGKDGKEYDDYSEKSQDLFKVMALWNQEMFKFEYRSGVENEVRLLSEIEKTKKSIVSTRGGGVAENNNNDVNSRYYDNFMNNFLYGRQYTDWNDAKFTINNERVKKINAFTKKHLGFDILPNHSEDFEISGTKAIETANRFFQMKVLGLNLTSALANLVGGKANSYINSGKFFTNNDLSANEMRLASSRFGTPEGQIAAGLVEYFVPLTDDEKVMKARKLSVKGAAANMSSDWLFYLMRGSDRFVQLPIFWSFAQNTMVENGELVNIRQYVKAKHGYEEFYSLPADQRREVKKAVEKEIKELQDSRSLFKVAKIENDELVIPGIERTSDTVYKFRNQVQQFSKDVLGNMDQNDIYQYRMNVLGRSLMMFKNWIPRMIDTRYGGLRYEVGKDDWEWGRVNMFFTAARTNLVNGIKTYLGMVSGEEGLIETARKIYQIKRAQFGEEDFMSEAEFIDMYIRGVRQVMRETLLWLSFTGMVWTAIAAVPDDDDDVKKGVSKWAQRATDKFRDELAFFYQPDALASMLGSSMFPSMSLLLDIERFVVNGSKDMFYTVMSDEEGQDKTKTSKYLFRMLPVTKELSSYIALFNEEWAKELGLRYATQNTVR